MYCCFCSDKGEYKERWLVDLLDFLFLFPSQSNQKTFWVDEAEKVCFSMSTISTTTCAFSRWIHEILASGALCVYLGCALCSDDLVYNLSSLAILDAIFLNPIEVPEIRLNLTPFNESRGSLHTSISHCTRLSDWGSPWTHNRRNFSRCS